jgi:FkbM family methyltransferase
MMASAGLAASGSPVAHRDALVLNVRGNARLCVPRALDQITPYVLLEQEDWFEDEIRFVRRWLGPGMRAIDVGANYGMYTVAAALSVGPAGRVWAFEPMPHCIPFLQRSLELNGCAQATLSPIAISDHNGSLSFALTAMPETSAVATGGAAGSADIAQLPAATLDEMAQQNGWADIDLVKVDVEGHETQVIRGGGAFFAANSPLVMVEVRAVGSVDFAALELLSEMGYAMYRLLPGPLVLVPFESAEPVDEFQLNLFACKQDRARQLANSGHLVDPVPAPAPAASQDDWSRYAATAPYARERSGGWRRKAGFFSGEGEMKYFESLAAFARSRDIEQGAAGRCGWLAHALECVEQSLESRDNAPRRLSHARLAWELGRREAAVASLFRVANALEEEGAQALAEPFLAPNARYESLPCARQPAEWLRCAVFEQLEKLRHHSSMFSRDRSSTLILESIMHLPFRSPEMDRRWQLLRMAAGEQAAPEPRPQLCVRTDENLNPEYWRGAQRA